MRMLLSFIILAISFVSCSSTPPHIKIRPQYTTIDAANPEVNRIIQEYVDLSMQYHIDFQRPVTVGFTKIDRGNIIGLCTYGGYFREIDLDVDFWQNATWASKIALLYHELTHCYCSRPHDYANGKPYSEDSLKWSIAKFFETLFDKAPYGEGYLTDGCPQSLMHPSIVSNSCLKEHYAYYVEEMFQRCDPWR